MDEVEGAVRREERPRVLAADALSQGASGSSGRPRPPGTSPTGRGRSPHPDHALGVRAASSSRACRIRSGRRNGHVGWSSITAAGPSRPRLEPIHRVVHDLERAGGVGGQLGRTQERHLEPVARPISAMAGASVLSTARAGSRPRRWRARSTPGGAVRPGVGCSCPAAPWSRPGRARGSGDLVSQRPPAPSRIQRCGERNWSTTSPEARLADAHVIEVLLEPLPGELAVEAPHQRHAFLARDVAGADLLRRVVGGAADAELDVGRVVVEVVDAVVDAVVLAVGARRALGRWPGSRRARPRSSSSSAGATSGSSRGSAPRSASRAELPRDRPAGRARGRCASRPILVAAGSGIERAAEVDLRLSARR